MRVRVAKVVNLAVEPPAAADLDAALRRQAEQALGCIDSRAKLLRLVDVVQRGAITLSRDFRHHGVRWTCAAVLEFEALECAPGEVYLFTLEESAARAVFSNAHCVANMLNAELAANYRPGDLVPLLLESVEAVRGQPVFNAVARPWTAHEARQPVWSEGEVTAAETEGFAELADTLEAALAAAEKAGPARAALGVADGGQTGQPLAQMLRELAPGKRPLEQLARAPGWGRATRGPGAAAAAATVQRPATALAELAYRELSLLEVLAALAQHPDRLRRGQQDRVWQIAAKSTLT